MRPAVVLKEGEVLDLGEFKMRLIETPHFPHGWDAHMWFEQKTKTLFSSDFCCHGGVSEPLATTNPTEKIISFYEKGGFIPYGQNTNQTLDKLMQLEFESLAVMHGSFLAGDLAREVFEKVKIDLLNRSK